MYPLPGSDTHLDGRIGVSDGASVAGVEEGDVLGAGGNGSNAAELVLGLLVRDSVNGESENLRKNRFKFASNMLKMTCSF